MLYADYRKKINSCPFCTPKERAFVENEYAYITYALAPYHPHHLLVIPKRHILSIFDITVDEQKCIDLLIEKSSSILKNLGYKNFTIMVREGDETGKTVPHMHYHLIPDDHIGDLDHTGSQRKILSPEEIDVLTKEIKAVINQ